MAGLIENWNIAEFLESEKGRRWMRSSVVKQEALNYYANQMIIRAWNAVHGQFPEPCWLHCSVEQPSRSADLLYWSVSAAPLMKDSVSAWQVNIYYIQPGTVKGRFDICFAVPINHIPKVMKLKNVAYTSFDPFMQYWIQKQVITES